MRTGTAEQLHWLDQTTINGDLETGLLLMERASRGLTDVALQYLEDEAEEGELPWAAVFCGTGNNGGDGVACARMLHEAGVKVRAFLVGKREKMTPDSKANEQRLNACGVQLEDFDPEDVDQHLFTCAAHVVIDALFGIGLGRDLAGDVVTAVEWINESDGIVIAADIPSGVQANTGCVMGTAVQADATVTFTMAKPGHIIGDGGLCTGALYIVDIGLDSILVDSLNYPVTILEEDTVRKLLPQRPRDGHKGTFGKVLLLAGSKPYPGAPIMASHTATHSGAGLVFLGIPETIYPITALKCVEEMPVALPDEQGALGEASVPVILEKLAEMQAALIGPGLGKLRLPRGLGRRRHTRHRRAYGCTGQPKRSHRPDAPRWRIPHPHRAVAGEGSLEYSFGLCQSPSLRFGLEGTPHHRGRPGWQSVSEHHRKRWPGQRRQRRCAGRTHHLLPGTGYGRPGSGSRRCLGPRQGWGSNGGTVWPPRDGGQQRDVGGHPCCTQRAGITLFEGEFHENVASEPAIVDRNERPPADRLHRRWEQYQG